MKKYNLKNQIHFVTIDTVKQTRLFNNDSLCRIIVDNLKFYRRKFDFKLLGFVIMPNHIHLLILLSEKHNDISKIMQFFKGYSARKIIDFLKEKDSKKLSLFRVQPEPLLGLSKGRSRGSDLPIRKVKLLKKERKIPEFQVWQPDFYDFNIYSEEKLEQKLGYIHFNPVKAGLCQTPETYKWSSCRYYEFKDDSLIKIDFI
ncbi:MAG: transposase [Patescibacteria group bacterium]